VSAHRPDRDICRLDIHITGDQLQQAGRDGGYSMPNEPVDMIMPMLREIRSEIGEIKQQLHKLDVGQKSIRNALTADTMMSKFITGDFEDRISELESKVEELLKDK
jgi:hypothetical protein